MAAPSQQTITTVAWGNKPLALAELALQIVPSDGAYLQRALWLAEATLAFGVCCALASARDRGAVPARHARAALVDPTPGKYLEAVRVLEKFDQRCTGWVLQQEVKASIELLRLGSLAPRHATVAHVLDVIPPLRNKWAHHDQLPAGDRRCADALFNAVSELVALNHWAVDYRMLWLTSVQHGTLEYQALALEGLGHAAFRKHDAHRLPQPSQRGHVVLLRRDQDGDGRSMLDLHPFVRCHDARVFLLIGEKNGRPLLKRPVDSSEWAGDHDELEQCLATWSLEDTVVDRRPAGVDAHAIAAAHEPPMPESPAAASGVGARAQHEVQVTAGVAPALSGQGRALVALAALAVLAGVLMLGTTLVLGLRSPAPPARPADPIAQWLTGLPLGWGASRAEVESLAGVPIRPDSGCDAPFLSDLDVTAGSALRPCVPGLTGGGVSIHSTEGMLDITFFSSISPADAAAMVTARFGPPEEIRGQLRTWHMGSIDIRVGQHGSGSVVRAWDVARTAALQEDRRAAGCSP